MYQACSRAVAFIRTESVTYPQNTYRYRESSKRDVSEEKKVLNDSYIFGNWSVIQEQEQRERFWVFLFSRDLSIPICCSNVVAEWKIAMLILGLLLPFVWRSTQELISSLAWSAAVWKLTVSTPSLYSSFTHCKYSCKWRVCSFQIKMSKHFENVKCKTEINRYE